MFVRGNNFFENNTFFIFIFVPITIFDTTCSRKEKENLVETRHVQPTSLSTKSLAINYIGNMIGSFLFVKLLFDIKIIRKARILLLLYSITVRTASVRILALVGNDLNSLIRPVV